MADFKTYAINIDNLFFDKKDVLNEGVLDFIYSIDENTKLIFFTKENEKNGMELIEKLNQTLISKGIKKIVADYTVFCDSSSVFQYDYISVYGAQVNYPAKVIKNILELTPNVTLKLFSKNINFIISPNKIKSLLSFFKGLKNKEKFESISKDDVEVVLDDFGIYKIEVEYDNEKEFELINKYFKNDKSNNITIDNKKIIVTQQSKLEILSKLLKKLDLNLGQVAYIGSNKTDIEAMKKSGVSLALGNDMEVLKSSNFAIDSLEDAVNVVDAYAINNELELSNYHAKSAMCIKNCMQDEASK